MWSYGGKGAVSKTTDNKCSSVGRTQLSDTGVGDELTTVHTYLVLSAQQSIIVIVIITSRMLNMFRREGAKRRQEKHRKSCSDAVTETMKLKLTSDTRKC